MMNKEDLKIIFFGTPEFAVESLDSIIKNGYNVVAAVTMPDKPAGRGHKMYHSPVKEYAVTHNIPLLQSAKLKNEEFLDALKSYNADLFIVIAFRMLYGKCRDWEHSISTLRFFHAIAGLPR